MRSAARNRVPRLGAGAATVVIHALLIALLLRTGVGPVVAIDQRPLSVFDVSLPVPPPPPPAESLRPADPGPAQPRATPHPAAAGRATSAAPVERRTIEQPPPLAMNVTLVPDISPVTLASTTAASSADGEGAAGSGGRGQGNGGVPGDGDRLEDGVPQRFQRADWIRRPTEAEINRYWLAEAIKRRLGGKVYLACALTRPGRPDRCIAIFEQPAGVGFGDAAVRLSRTFRIRPIRINDRDAADLPVIVPVTFYAKK